MPKVSSKIALDGITFDDVLLLPRYTDFKRDAVDLSTTLHPKLSLKLPILSSPMDTVTEVDMAIAMAEAGGMGVIHRNLNVDTQAGMVKQVKRKHMVAAAIGAGSDMQERVKALVDAGVDMIVVDSGHGHSQFIMECVKHIKKQYKGKVIVMAGNVATYEGAKDLIKAGADILRVGVGPGSICTTRVVTGMGVPQVTACLEAARACKGTKVTFVADGGIRQMGDMAKALATGASAVMLGSMLAGYTQSPGDEVTVEGKTYKKYRGMGSIGAMQKGGAERYGQSAKTERSKLVAEGVEGLVPFKGDVHDFLYQATGALRSSFYYLGCTTMKDFHKNARFTRITAAGMKESHPHTIAITDAGESYMR